MATTHYAVLGITETATQSEIKKQFHSLSRTYHPDKNKQPGSEDKFKQILDAYNVLKDAQTRKKYDLQNGLNTQAAPRRPPPSSTPSANSYKPTTSSSSSDNPFNRKPRAPSSSSARANTFPVPPYSGAAGTYFDMFGHMFRKRDPQQPQAERSERTQREKEMKRAQKAYRTRLAEEASKKEAAKAQLELERRRAKQKQEAELRALQEEEERRKQAERQAHLEEQERQRQATYRAYLKEKERRRQAELERKRQLELDRERQAALRRAAERRAAQEQYEAEKRAHLAAYEKHVRIENRELLSSLGFLDSNGDVDMSTMIQFKAYSQQHPSELAREQMLNAELKQVQAQYEARAAQARASKRHFAKQPDIVDLTAEDEDLTRDVQGKNTSADDPVVIEDSEDENSGSTSSRPVSASKRGLEEEKDTRPTSKKARADPNGGLFGSIGDLGETLPDVPPAQYNPKKDSWYQQGVPSQSPRPQSISPNEKNNRPVSGEDIHKHHLEVIQYGKKHAQALLDRFTQLEKSFPPAGDFDMPQPEETFTLLMERTRAPMREMSAWYEEMIELNKRLQKEGRSI